MSTNGGLCLVIAPKNLYNSIVYKTHTLRLRAIPTSLFPELKWGIYFVPLWATVTIQAAGDYVALLVRGIQHGTSAYVDIWNWTHSDSPHRLCR